ncbi:unnamed protein product [Leptidea sinapis]|uniref:Neurotransmitter-gated ion-channel transmembrane domain-containing protein n=1 Tax=Leptidea sinapis TaxID=189913 RepID=A0A5E4Q804_9NEOP|nr:unnamed protein product [Leptidea sinapis]
MEKKKVNSKYILKSTLTPRLARKELQKELQESSPQLSKSSFPSAMNLPTITTQSYDDLVNRSGNRQHNSCSEGSDEPPKHHTWTQMTPQEIATWIDKRSRVMFPLLFILFNILYWTFVYCL